MRLLPPRNQLKHWNDERLMQGIQNGDCKSFDELYLRYSDRLYYYFFRMLGFEHHVAEDFVQDLFVRIIEKPHRFDVSKKFSTWVFSVAHNMCKNEYRSREIRSVVTNADNIEGISEETDNKSIESRNINEIFKVVDKMDGGHKTVFLLKYREGFSIDEISEVVNLPKGTVKSRLHYARKKIQEKITVNQSI